jgi:hypothetical protein
MKLRKRNSFAAMACRFGSAAIFRLTFWAKLNSSSLLRVSMILRQRISAFRRYDRQLNTRHDNRDTSRALALFAGQGFSLKSHAFLPLSDRSAATD